jgi:signal peptidase
MAAILGACCVLAFMAPLFGMRLLVLTSGSMSPAIPTGSLALAKETSASDLRVGDVITVPDGDTLLTHSIVEISPSSGSQVSVLLKGDANQWADPTMHRVSAAPRVLVSVPHLGSAIAWFSHPVGRLLLIAYAAVVLWMPRRRSSKKLPAEGRLRFSSSAPAMRAVAR